MKKNLSPTETQNILDILEKRFLENPERHQNISWEKVLEKLQLQPNQLFSIAQMEKSGGEPDVLDFVANAYVFVDCAMESPTGRRSFCYDKLAWEKRKTHKPENNAKDYATAMGIQILNEEQYRKYQAIVGFDSKTSSWIDTPEKIRKLGGALFCDFRFDTVFTYHNGAESYYAARGFRGFVLV